MTIVDITWLLFGAALGVAAAFAIPYGLGVIARVFRIDINKS